MFTFHCSDWSKGSTYSMRWRMEILDVQRATARRPPFAQMAMGNLQRAHAERLYNQHWGEIIKLYTFASFCILWQMPELINKYNVAKKKQLNTIWFYSILMSPELNHSWSYHVFLLNRILKPYLLMFECFIWKIHLLSIVFSEHLRIHSSSIAILASPPHRGLRFKTKFVEKERILFAYIHLDRSRFQRNGWAISSFNTGMVIICTIFVMKSNCLGGRSHLNLQLHPINLFIILLVLFCIETVLKIDA